MIIIIIPPYLFLLMRSCLGCFCRNRTGTIDSHKLLLQFFLLSLLLLLLELHCSIVEGGASYSRVMESFLSLLLSLLIALTLVHGTLYLASQPLLVFFMSFFS